MKHSITLACCALASFSVGFGCARLPPSSKAQTAESAAAKANAAAVAKKEAETQAAAVARKEAEAQAEAEDRVVANYSRSRTPVTRVERLTCFSGNRNRHARIGVELIDGKVDYFAFYSKWKPRTCSIEAKRGGAYNRWEDRGAMSKVTLVDGKGLFLIDGKRDSYRFVFRGIDRGRYCGMDGQINGSLTIMRGRSDCIVQGIMDGHAN